MTDQIMEEAIQLCADDAHEILKILSEKNALHCAKTIATASTYIASKLSSKEDGRKFINQIFADLEIAKRKILDERMDKR